MVEAAFYGDDFTGSTDAMVQFARVGLRSVLLVTLPSASELRELAERYDVIGVAGIARSLPPDEQEAELRPVLQALRDLGPRVLQYKVCSTADSSPTRGSIGRALEIGREVCGTTVVPVLIAQPELGRYTVFSHHFAAEAGTVHRLDRQPTMSTHPATPMHESDLREHLSRQTSLPLGALHLTTYSTLATGLTAAGDVAAAILDALTDEDLRLLGKVILGDAGEARFVVGSGGMSRAVALALRPDGGAATAAASRVGGPVLVVSGSQSRRTAGQIEYARSAGWEVLPLADSATAQTTAALADGTMRQTTAVPADGAVGQAIGAPADGVSGQATAVPADGMAGQKTASLADGVAAQTTAGPPDGTAGQATAVPADGAVGQALGAPADGVPGQATAVPADGMAGQRTASLADGVAAQTTAGPPDGTAGQATTALADGEVGRVIGAFVAGVDGVVVHTNELDPRDLAQVPAALAEVVRGVAAAVGVRRVVVAGGDTSGQVLRELGVSALELVDGSESIAPGVHLCRAASGEVELDGLELLLKPGQLGEVDLFTRFRRWSG
ncbi:four-carbon acid sugar kinase family protein [Kribbella sp. NPDC050459]|uniref:four-carbon acid sugar kinase family protein n=1 Tax=Kribbella sp. NPDC050459 TaxID=3155785 RepID=UPI0033CB4A50